MRLGISLSRTSSPANIRVIARSIYHNHNAARPGAPVTAQESMEGYQFTAEWAEFWPTNYEVEDGYDPFCPAPEVPEGYEAVPYLDRGYWGGTYWAILPQGWTRESAQEIFDSEGHINSLIDIGWNLVGESHRPTAV